MRSPSATRAAAQLAYGKLWRRSWRSASLLTEAGQQAASQTRRSSTTRRVTSRSP